MGEMNVRCVVCDRCREIIEDPRKCRVITCAKPLRVDMEPKHQCRGNDRMMNDILWEKELCSTCADLLESFMENSSDIPEPSPEPEPTPDPEPSPDPEPGGENTDEPGGGSDDNGGVEP